MCFCIIYIISILLHDTTYSNNTRSTDDPGALSSLKMLNGQTDRTQGIQIQTAQHYNKHKVYRSKRS